MSKEIGIALIFSFLIGASFTTILIVKDKQIQKIRAEYTQEPIKTQLR